MFRFVSATGGKHRCWRRSARDSIAVRGFHQARAGHLHRGEFYEKTVFIRISSTFVGRTDRGPSGYDQESTQPATIASWNESCAESPTVATWLQGRRQSATVASRQRPSSSSERQFPQITGQQLRQRLYRLFRYSAAFPEFRFSGCPGDSAIRFWSQLAGAFTGLQRTIRPSEKATE